MYRPFKRKKNRSKTKVKADIKATKKLVREDIHDLLKLSQEAGMTQQEAEDELVIFLKSASGLEKYIEKHGSLDTVIARTVSDVPSYQFEWA